MGPCAQSLLAFIRISKDHSTPKKIYYGSDNELHGISCCFVSAARDPKQIYYTLVVLSLFGNNLHTLEEKNMNLE